MKIKLVLSFLLGSLLTALIIVLGFAKYMQAERDKLYYDARKSMVIVANADLESGTILDKEVLALKSFYEKSLSSHSFYPEQLEQILNKELHCSVVRGEPILTVYLKEK